MIVHQIGNSQGNYSYSANIYKNVQYHSHFHANYELIYVLDGRAQVGINGVSQVLYQGELLLIPPYIVHSFSVDECSDIWIGVFSEDFIMSFARKNEGKRFSAFTCEAQIEKMLQKYLFVEQQPDHFMLISCLYMALNECEKNAKMLEETYNFKFMHSVIEYISENICNEASLKDMATELGYEYHYLSMLFNDCFGMNFKNFLNMYRYDIACRKLMDKNKDITVICDECGFGSVRNFNRVFKNMSGMTPREYRNQ